jgi:hypothetical protein
LRDKTLTTDLPELAKHFKLPDIFRAEEFTGQSGVFVLGYSEISQTKASDLIDRIQPDLIVADEVQNLKARDSARTKRFLRFMRKNPCKFVAMTGSAVTRSIKDFSHLIELALGKNSPVPKDYPSLSAWADAIDNEGKDGATGIGALALLCDDNESAREGFQRRFRETSGVIVTQMSAASMPIEIREISVAPPANVLAALDKLEKDWEWNGEEISNSLDIARFQKQLTQGFYYRPVWPDGIPDREWVDKRNAWNKAVRDRLKTRNRVGEDSPALLEKMAMYGGWACEEWADWAMVRDRPEPPREAVEISRWLVDYAHSWIPTDPRPAIIWVSSPVVGAWLQESGIPYFGQGQDAELNKLADDCLSGNQETLTISCSIQAHNTGKNLQAWARNLVLYPMAQGASWEQLIGRSHRPGQMAIKVTLDVLLASISAHKAMLQAYEDSKFIQETLGQPQKLLLALKV